MNPWNCAVLWSLSTKAQFVGLPESTLKVIFFPRGEQEKDTASDRSSERNTEIGIIVIRKNSGSL